MREDHPIRLTRGFRVHTYEAEGALVVECHGRLIRENAPALKEELKEKLAGTKRIVMDLKDVPSMDSSGLGAVVGLYVSARTRGCQFQLINAGQQIRDLLRITNLLVLFEAAGRHGGRLI
jgi:anti-anti-sigma factor